MADGNTIAEKIADIAASKAAIAAAIEAKGVVVPEGAKLAELAAKVEAIETGGTSGEGYAHFWEDPQFVDRANVTAAHDFVPTELPRVQEDYDIRFVPDGLFAHDAGLKHVDLTKTNDIGAYCGAFSFYLCKNLESVTFNDRLPGLSMPIVGVGAFYGCSSLKTIVWPTKRSDGDEIVDTQIGLSAHAFSGCGIETLDFGNIFDTSVGVFPCESAFSGCKNLKSVHFSRCIGLDAYIFSGCSALESVVIDVARTYGSGSLGGYFEVYQGAFKGCSSLRKAVFQMPKTGFGSIYGFCFCSRNATSSPDFGGAYKEVGSQFYGCSSLEELTIPCLTSGNDNEQYLISNSAFSGCSSLKVFDSSIDNWSPNKQIAHRNAFFGCTSLQTVNLVSAYNQDELPQDYPDRLHGISTGESAFNGLPELTTVTLTDQLTEISVAAFYNCKKLQSFTIEDSGMSPLLDDIKLDVCNEAFYLCGALTTFSIPESRAVTRVGKNAFHNTKALKSTIRLAENAVVERRAFMLSGIPSVVFGENCEIGEEAFIGSGLTSLSIPAGTKIGEGAFSFLESCMSIAIAAGVVSISQTAFQMLNPACIVVFEMTKAEVQAMANYPFGFDLVNDPERKDFILHCTDGDLAVPHALSGGETTQAGGAQ